MYLRLLGLIVRMGLEGSCLRPLDEACLHFRVGPTDIDLNGHMNNGRYLSFMDLGRLHFMGSIGVLVPALRRRWFPVMKGLSIEYHRGLRLGETFELKTQLVTWDERWFIMEQFFERQGRLVACARMQTLLRARGCSISPREVLGLLGPVPEAPRDRGESVRWTHPAEE